MISLGADFRGTQSGILVDTPPVYNYSLAALSFTNSSSLSYINGSAPSVLQQRNASSQLLNTLYAKGGSYNWVPTTSISSASDEVSTPQISNSMEGSTSFIGGSRTGNIQIQDYCPNLTVSHEQFLYADFPYQVVRLALLAGPGRPHRQEYQQQPQQDNGGSGNSNHQDGFRFSTHRASRISPSGSGFIASPNAVFRAVANGTISCTQDVWGPGINVTDIMAFQTNANISTYVFSDFLQLVKDIRCVLYADISASSCFAFFSSMIRNPPADLLVDREPPIQDYVNRFPDLPQHD